MQRQSSNISENGGNTDYMGAFFRPQPSVNNNNFVNNQVNNNTTYSNITNYYGLVEILIIKLLLTTTLTKQVKKRIYRYKRYTI